MTVGSTLTDPEIMAKLDRIILFLDSRGAGTRFTEAQDIKLEYIQTGKLTKDDMRKLNESWQKCGGGRW